MESTIESRIETEFEKFRKDLPAFSHYIQQDFAKWKGTSCFHDEKIEKMLLDNSKTYSGDKILYTMLLASQIQEKKNHQNKGFLDTAIRASNNLLSRLNLVPKEVDVNPDDQTKIVFALFKEAIINGATIASYFALKIKLFAKEEAFELCSLSADRADFRGIEELIKVYSNPNTFSNYGAKLFENGYTYPPILFEAGKRRYRNGKISEAVALFKQAVADYGESISAAQLNYIAQVYLTGDDYQNAAKYYERAKSVYGNAVPDELFFNLGDSYFALGDIAKALESYKAIASHCYRSSRLTKLATVYMKLESYENAAATIKQLYEEFGVRTLAILCDLGDVYTKLGNFEEAKRFYEQALFTSENHVLSAKAAALIEKVKELSG